MLYSFASLFVKKALIIPSSKKAIFHLTRALATTPEDEKVHYYLGVAHEKLEDYKSAIFHFEKATDYSMEITEEQVIANNDVIKMLYKFSIK